MCHQYMFSYDVRCGKDIKLQQPTKYQSIAIIIIIIIIIFCPLKMIAVQASIEN